MKNNKYLIAIVLLFSTQLACVKNPDAIPQSQTNRPLLTILKNNFSFSLFYSALQRTGLDKTLEGNGPFTILAPDNDAFTLSGISADSLARIDTSTLKKLIGYHIIPENISYASIPQTIDFAYKSLAGPQVYFSIPLPGPQQLQGLQNQIVHIDGVNVNRVDIAASNGYIIDLSKVLSYPATSVKAYLESKPQYSFFTQALKQFGLFDMLDQPGPFVVLAPTNDIFIQNGINQDSIAGLDTLTYKKFLFSVDVLTHQLFFSTDFIDAPPPQTFPVYATSDVLLLFSVDYYNVVSYNVVPFNYTTIQAYPTAPPYYGNANIYGPSSPIILSDPDHLAANGVVYGINGLPVLPDSVKIH